MFQYLSHLNVIFRFIISLFACALILIYCILIYFAILTNFEIYLKCFINSDSFVNTTRQHI